MVMFNLLNKVVLSVAACRVLRGGGGAGEKGGIIHQSAEGAAKRTLPSRDWCLAFDLIGREHIATNHRAYLNNRKVV